MAAFSQSDDLQGAQFVDVNLRGARFVRSDLSGAVMRAVDAAGADIDAPWLVDGESFLRVNGVNVVPYVEAELNRRFPGRAEDAPEIPNASMPPGPYWSGPGRRRSIGSRKCRPERWMSRWMANGHSPRRCVTW